MNSTNEQSLTLSEAQQRILTTLKEHGFGTTVRGPIHEGVVLGAEKGGAAKFVGDQLVFVAVNNGKAGQNEIVSIPAATYKAEPDEAWSLASGATAFEKNDADGTIAEALSRVA